MCPFREYDVHPIDLKVIRDRPITVLRSIWKHSVFVSLHRILQFQKPFHEVDYLRLVNTTYTFHVVCVWPVASRQNKKIEELNLFHLCIYCSLKNRILFFTDLRVRIYRFFSSLGPTVWETVTSKLIASRKRPPNTISHVVYTHTPTCNRFFFLPILRSFYAHSHTTPFLLPPIIVYNTSNGRSFSSNSRPTTTPILLFFSVTRLLSGHFRLPVRFLRVKSKRLKIQMNNRISRLELDVFSNENSAA